MDRASARWQPVAVAGVLVLVALAYWQWRVVAPVRLPQPVVRWNQDLYTIYLPVYAYAYGGDAFLPRWNPHQLAGMPLIANYNGGVLYPLHFLAALLPVPLALGLGCALHLALAGFGVFLCVRALGLSLPAAALGAVLFPLNHYFVGSHFQPSYLSGHAWIPFAFLAGGRLLMAPAARTGVLLGLVLAVQLLTGHAQIVCYSAYALLFSGLTYLGASGSWDRAHLRRVLAATALAAVTTLMLAAVQVLPTLELLARAARGGLTVEQTLPGKPTRAIAASVVLASGPAAILLVAAWLDRRRRAVVLAATVLLVAGLVIGIGTPAYTHFFYHLPGIDRFRIPNRMWLFAILALALLAAIGVDAARRTDRPLRARLGIAGLLAATAAGAYALGVRTNVYGTALISAAILLPLVRRATLAWGLVALVVLERFAQPGNGMMIPQNNDAAFFAPPAFVHFIKEHGSQDRTVIIKDWARRYPMMEKAGSLWGFDVAQDFEPLTPRAYQEFLLPFERYNTDAPLFWGRFRPPSQHVSWRALDLMAVRWVAVDAAVAWRNDNTERFRLAYEDATARVYENMRSLPRAFLVGGDVVVAEASAALAQVHAPGFDPRTTVVVDRPVRWRSEERREDLTEAVRIQALSPDEVRLDVVTPGPSVLVLADLFWPGWKVAVDGDERTLHRVNYLFRGVALEAGAHSVRFWYHPASVTVGLLITGATATAVLLAGVLGRRRLGSL